MSNVLDLADIGGLGVGLAETKLGGIPTILLEVLAELAVLLGNGVLTDIGQAEKGNGGGDDAESRGNVKGVLGGLGLVVTAEGSNGVKGVGANKGANLANGGGDAVVATTDTGSAGLGGEETNVVARAELAEGEEDAVDDGKGSDAGGDFRVDAGHDEADEGLGGDADDEGVLGADPVRDKGAEDGAGEVEHVDDGVPAKDGGEGGVGGAETGENGGRVDAKGIARELDKSQIKLQGQATGQACRSGICTYIVEEPDDGDGSESEPVVLEDEEVGSLFAHRLLGKLFGLLETETEDEEDEGEDDTDAQAGAPDDFVVGVVGGGGDDVWMC